MYKKVAIFSAVSLLLAACQPKPDVAITASALPDGVTLVDNHQPAQGQVGIAYKKYKLSNGLTVVLHEDHSDPLVHVDVTYHVGSAREEVGKSGFAHFFEHMMFQGSEHVGDDQHFKIITEAGGEMNGSTNSDRTNYYQTVPANQLEKVLWLEADRMGFLLPAVTQEKFEIQRDTVKNERGQRLDNRPYGLRAERNSEALYPVGHPYSWQTIGYVEDLDRVNVNDLKAFFKRWYGPNNAVLTIGGDIDVTQTLAWVNKYFATIPAGPEVKDAPKAPVTLDKDRYVTLEDEVHLPLLQLTFPTVYVRHQDEAPLDVLANILGGGKTSLFYKNMVKDGYAVQAVVSHPCEELACEFQLIALANPAKVTELSTLFDKMMATLDEFEQRDISADDLQRTKSAIEASNIFGLQSVSGKVSSLASDETYTHHPDQVQNDLDRYNNVTADDVKRVYNTYIKGKAKVVLSIVPKGQTQLAAREADFTPPARDIPATAQVQAEDVKAPDIHDSFDRNAMPKAGPTPVVKVPEFVKQTWKNGIQVLASQTSETPTVTISFAMEGGSLLDPIDKAGLASLTASMMNESTENLSNEELANQLALLGSSIRFSAAGRTTQVTVSSLSKNLDKTLAILQQQLFTPAFLPEDFNRLKQRLMQSIEQGLKDPDTLASMATDELMYGKDSRLGLPDGGTLETIRNITLDDVKGFYADYYSPAKGSLVVVGDIAPTELENRLSFLANWQGSDYSVPHFSNHFDASEPRIYLVDKPGSAQSVIRLLRPDLPYDALGEQFRSKLMNFALGGMFNSRVNMALREEKGYTYGARTWFAGGKETGAFMASSDVKQPNTGDAIAELLAQVKNYQANGMTEQELDMMRSAFTQSDALKYETPGDKAGFLRHLLTFNLDGHYTEEQNAIIRSISLDELNQLAGKKLDTDSMQILVVGDASVVTPQLESLGRKIVPLSVN